MIELERTFLPKFLPDLSNCEKKEIIDIYLPKVMPPGIHCPIRIRKNGDVFEFTKKTIVSDDHREMQEETILLTQQEFDSFKGLDGKKIHKFRYLLPYKGFVAEIDIFQGDLKGLMVVEFEFDNKQQADSFDLPDFCLVDIGAKKQFLAGGEICGKSFADIKPVLDELGYEVINYG